MKGKTIAIINQKGGVGKTTTAAELAAILSKMNYKVLAVDLDAQASLTLIMGGAREKVGTAEVLKGSAAKSALQTVNGVDIMAGGSGLADIENDLSAARKLNKYGLLRSELQQLRNDYDFIILDPPPALGLPSLNALIAADTLIIPVQADALSLNGMSDLYETITAVKEELNPDLDISGILITRYNQRTRIAKDLTEVAEDLAATMQTKVFDAKIREATAVKEAQTMQRSVTEYARRSGAAADYTAFTDELLQDLRRRG